MIKGKLLWFWIVILIVSLVVGVAIASLKYNASAHAIQWTLTVSGMVFTVLAKLFSKDDEKAPVESPSEKKLVSSLNVLAGWSVLAVVLGVVIGFNVLGYLERRGVHSSGYELLFLMVVYPVVVLIIYLTKRSEIIKHKSSADSAC